MLEIIRCKDCQSSSVVKNGQVRQKQRWQCKYCGFNFVLGDARKGIPPARIEKKSLAILLVSLGLSFKAAALAVGVSKNTVMLWFRDWPEIPESSQTDEITLERVTLDDLPHFIQSRQAEKTAAGERLLLVQLDAPISQWGVVTVKL